MNHDWWDGFLTASVAWIPLPTPSTLLGFLFWVLFVAALIATMIVTLV